MEGRAVAVAVVVVVVVVGRAVGGFMVVVSGWVEGGAEEGNGIIF